MKGIIIAIAIVLSLLIVESNATTEQCVDIYGYNSCGYYQRAKCWGNNVRNAKGWKVTVSPIPFHSISSSTCLRVLSVPRRFQIAQRLPGGFGSVEVETWFN